MAEQSLGSVVSLRTDVENISSPAVPAIQGIVSRDFFDAVFDQSQPMYMVRPDGTVIYVNSGYVDLFDQGTAVGAKNKIFPSLKSDHLEIVRRIAKSKEVEITAT